jgi:hypothetical protein
MLSGDNTCLLLLLLRDDVLFCAGVENAKHARVMDMGFRGEDKTYSLVVPTNFFLMIW